MLKKKRCSHQIIDFQGEKIWGGKKILFPVCLIAAVAICLCPSFSICLCHICICNSCHWALKISSFSGRPLNSARNKHSAECSFKTMTMARSASTKLKMLHKPSRRLKRDRKETHTWPRRYLRPKILASVFALTNNFNGRWKNSYRGE